MPDRTIRQGVPGTLPVPRRQKPVDWRDGRPGDRPPRIAVPLGRRRLVPASPYRLNTTSTAAVSNCIPKRRFVSSTV